MTEENLSQTAEPRAEQPHLLSADGEAAASSVAAEFSEATVETTIPPSQPKRTNPSRPGFWSGSRLPAAGVVLAAAAILLAVLLGGRSPAGKASQPEEPTALPGRELASASLTDIPVDLPPLVTPEGEWSGGIRRLAWLYTDIPNRPRSEVITYTVKTGDNLFTIAEQFGLKPETLLWGNYEVLKDNPQMLSPDQVLNVLPEDGAYYQWKEGDNLNRVAAEFTVTPEDIIGFTGNNLDLTAIDDPSAGIEVGTWLVIPGGTRPLKDWGPPAISRSNPASAAYYGEGHCGSVYEGAIGTGGFVWPTTDHFISGYNYSGIHRGIDIGGSMGNAIFATDGGVVVYAGWSNFGYGNLIVIDHGTGWQSAYAHLSSIGVSCGQSVGQGTYIGGLGSTGNSSGPHLHFELVFNGSKPNPLDYVQ